MFVDNDETQEFYRLIRGKSYTDVLEMLHTREYDATHFVVGKNQIVEKSKFEAQIKDYMRQANR